MDTQILAQFKKFIIEMLYLLSLRQTGICDFWLKNVFFLPKIFFRLNVLAITGSVELKTDSRYAHWLRLYNFLKQL